MNATSRIRIGAVSYLNTRALVHGLEQGEMSERIDLSYAVPSKLAEQMKRGELDVALMPVIALAEQPELELVPGLSIGTYGPSRSVLMLSKRPFEQIDTVALDPESRTSNILVQVLARHHWKFNAKFVAGSGDLEQDLKQHDAAIQIGDKALFLPPPEGCEVHDLGTAWTQFTARPFIFAGWFSRPGVMDRDLYQALHSSRRAGARAVSQIAETYRWNDIHDAELAEHYLREHIQHRLGANELDAMRTFYGIAAQMDLIDRPPEIRLAFQRWTTCHESLAERLSSGSSR